MTMVQAKAQDVTYLAEQATKWPDDLFYSVYSYAHILLLTIRAFGTFYIATGYEPGSSYLDGIASVACCKVSQYFEF